MRKGNIVNCRECETPMLGSLDGVVMGRNKDEGWCSSCIAKSAYLMAYLSKLVMEDIEFGEVKRRLTRKVKPVSLDEFGGFVGDVCPKCGDDFVEGGAFSACRKCTPEYFKNCEDCGFERINCICCLEDMIL